MSMNTKNKSEFKKAFFWNYPLSMLWAACILILCIMKISDISPPKFNFKGLDKCVHFAFFFFFTLFIFYEGNRQPYSPISRIKLSWGLIAITILYGGGIELLQKYIFTYRSGEWLDLLADVSGGLLGVILYNFISFKKKVITHAQNILVNPVDI